MTLHELGLVLQYNSAKLYRIYWIRRGRWTTSRRQQRRFQSFINLKVWIWDLRFESAVCCSATFSLSYLHSGIWKKNERWYRLMSDSNSISMATNFAFVYKQKMVITNRLSIQIHKVGLFHSKYQIQFDAFVYSFINIFLHDKQRLFGRKVSLLSMFQGFHMGETPSDKKIVV